MGAGALASDVIVGILQLLARSRATVTANKDATSTAARTSVGITTQGVRHAWHDASPRGQKTTDGNLLKIGTVSVARNNLTVGVVTAGPQPLAEGRALAINITLSPGLQQIPGSEQVLFHFSNDGLLAVEEGDGRALEKLARHCQRRTRHEGGGRKDDSAELHVDVGGWNWVSCIREE